MNLCVVSKGSFTTCKKRDNCPPWIITAKEVEHDKSATIQAALVVIFSSLAAGIGAIHLGASNLIFFPLFLYGSNSIERA